VAILVLDRGPTPRATATLLAPSDVLAFGEAASLLTTPGILSGADTLAFTEAAVAVQGSGSDPNRPPDVTWVTAGRIIPSNGVAQSSGQTVDGFSWGKGTYNTHFGVATGSSYSVNDGNTTLTPGAGPVDSGGKILWTRVRATGNAQGSAVRLDLAPTLALPNNVAKSLFFDFTVQIASDWDGHTSNQCKMFWFGVNDGISTVGQGILAAWGANQGTIGAGPYWQGTAGDATGIKSPRGTLTRGAWHRLQFLVVLESALGANDGIWKWWKDGTLVGAITTFDFGATVFTKETKLEWYWGGTGDSAPWDLYAFMDYVKVSYSTERSAG
jgi:hypothetical protein